jgi:hypothetical protein
MSTLSQPDLLILPSPVAPPSSCRSSNSSVCVSSDSLSLSPPSSPLSLSSPSSPSSSSSTPPDVPYSASKNLIHFINIRGLRSKQADIKQEIHAMTNSACVSFAETHLEPSDDAPKLYGYNPTLFSHKRGSAGLALYASVPCSDIKKMRMNVQGSMRMFSYLTLFGGLRVLLGVVYVRPAVTGEVLSKVLKAIKMATRTGLPVLLLGDFNQRHPEFGDQVKRVSSTAKLFCSFLNDFSLTVLNVRDCPGQFTREQSVLDLAITTHPELFSLKLGVLRLPASDHRSLCVTVTPPVNTPPADIPIDIPRWNTRNANWDVYHNSLQNRLSGEQTAFFSLRSSPSLRKQEVIDRMAQLLTDALIECADIAIPRSEPRKPYVPEPLSFGHLLRQGL